jgi:cytoskeletal protein CcmA (bactofilin family)
LVPDALSIRQIGEVATGFSRPAGPPVRASPFEFHFFFKKKRVQQLRTFTLLLRRSVLPRREPFCNATFKRLPTVSSHLSSDIQIEGDLNCSTDLIFDGSIKGNITSKGSLTIGQNASVNGNLKAEKAVIEGKVVGNGDFNSCRLSPTSVISGSVNTVSLQMEEGASLEGQCKVGKARA